MKTLEELFAEIAGSADLKAEIKAVKDKDGLAKFIEKNGCAATADEFIEFAKAQSEGEIGDDALESVAGGISAWWNPFARH